MSHRTVTFYTIKKKKNAEHIRSELYLLYKNITNVNKTASEIKISSNSYIIYDVRTFGVQFVVKKTGHFKSIIISINSGHKYEWLYVYKHTATRILFILYF